MPLRDKNKITNPFGTYMLSTGPLIIFIRVVTNELMFAVIADNHAG